MFTVTFTVAISMLALMATSVTCAVSIKQNSTSVAAEIVTDPA